MGGGGAFQCSPDPNTRRAGEWGKRSESGGRGVRNSVVCLFWRGIFEFTIQF